MRARLASGPSENTQSGMELHQTFYFFDLGDRKLVATCTRLANCDKEVEALCDASLRTVRLEADWGSP